MNNNVLRTDLLVRATPHQVFDAFVQPDMIKKFWLRRTSGPLAHGVTVDWEFMAEGSTERATVTDVRAPNLIPYSWTSGIDVELRLDVFGGDGTRVAAAASKARTRQRRPSPPPPDTRSCCATEAISRDRTLRQHGARQSSVDRRRQSSQLTWKPLGDQLFGSDFVGTPHARL